MSLFTDGVIATIGDLRGYESSILDVAHTEGIELGTKLELSQEEVAVELEAMLLRARAGAWGTGRPNLNNVVVTRPLKQWLVFHTLAVVFRDAYNSQLNDRYMGKWKEYSQLAKWAARMLRETGVGLVSAPVVKAAAPTLSTTPGAGAAARYYVQVAWRKANGVEGAPSDVSIYDTTASELLTVAVNDAPAVAAGWSVYVGTSPTAIMLQSEAAIAAGQVWTAPGPNPVASRKPGQGQEPETYLTIGQTLHRG